MATLVTDHHDLCLACCSSLPTQAISGNVFTTQCCNRSICSQCVTSNPRLARYNPCLACLGGVGVIAAGNNPSVGDNIDGSVRDEDNFVLGDDEDEDGDGDGDAPPAYLAVSVTRSNDQGAKDHEPTDKAAPRRYFIQRLDTLQGIALRFGLNGREICSLNNLPQSTLSVTPHILHTRDSILLPPSAKASSTDLNEPSPEEQREREARRAEKRLQVLTKEADWRIARAYVAVSDPADSYEEGKKSADLEARALDRYLDDDEWERRAGKPCIQGFPYFQRVHRGSCGEGTC